MRNPNLHFIRVALKELGAPIPEAFTRTEEQTAKISEAYKQLSNQSFGFNAIAEAWGNAVLDDRDPSTDPDIIRALVASALSDGDVGYAASNIVEQRLIDDLANLLPTIMGTFKKAVAKAGDTLTKAYQILGDTSLDNVSTIHNLGPAALQASIDATEASRIIRVIDNAWRALAETTHFASVSTPFLLRFTAAGIDQWEQLRNVRDPWIFAQHGLTIDLATTGKEVQARQDHVDQGREERDAQRAKTEKDALGREYRFR